MSSFFPWMGGKSRMAKRLAELLRDHKCYVEVFAGAANLLFAKSPSPSEAINDINDDLVTLYRVVRCHEAEFLRELRGLLHSRTEFSDYQSQPGLTDIQKAARLWFILKACFGGKAGTNDCHFGYVTTGKSRFRRSALSAVRRSHKRLDGVCIENLDFEDVIRRYDRAWTAFYCDPPYLGTAGYKGDFGMADQQRLAATLAAIKGKFLLSINDHPEIRKLYKGFKMLSVTTRYTVSRDKQAAAGDRRELLIANYKLPRKF